MPAYCICCCNQVQSSPIKSNQVQSSVITRTVSAAALLPSPHAPCHAQLPHAGGCYYLCGGCLVGRRTGRGLPQLPLLLGGRVHLRGEVIRGWRTCGETGRRREHVQSDGDQRSSERSSEMSSERSSEDGNRIGNQVPSSAIKRNYMQPSASRPRCCTDASAGWVRKAPST